MFRPIVSGGFDLNVVRRFSVGADMRDIHCDAELGDRFRLSSIR